ncbi:HAD-like domain-containing protein [Mrakia frigida]|uniref:haloacid dehalogenase superfamily protein n=1 Tax=Mrakia frigida TaxID=29902 RepID=UPI003FCC101E
MASTEIDYVVFDMDGLLLDTEVIYTIATQEIFTRFGLEVTWEIKSGLMGKPPLLAAAHLWSSFPPGSIPSDYTPEMYLLERTALQDAAFRAVLPLPGALELVRTLKERGVKIALATGSSKESFEMKTAHLPHLFSLFPADCLLTSSSPPVRPLSPTSGPTPGKPNPHIFLSAARALGIPVGVDEEPANEEERRLRSRGLVFEDAKLGVEAGVRAGMNVVWVPDPELKALHPNSTLGAKEVFSSLLEFDLEKWGL